MAEKYVLNISDENAKQILKNSFSEEYINDIFSKISFGCAQFVNDKKHSRIEISIEIKDAVPGEFFAELASKVSAMTGRETAFLFDFSPSVDRAQLVKNFWQFFTAELEPIKVWLREMEPVLEGKKLTLAGHSQLAAEKISDKKILSEIQRKLKSYFGIEAEPVPEVKSAPAGEPEEEKLSIKAIKVNGPLEKTSKVLVKEEIGGKISTVAESHNKGRFVVEGRVFTGKEWRINTKDWVIAVFYITDEQDTIKVKAFVKEDDLLLDELQNLKYVRARMEVKEDQREMELVGMISKMHAVAKEEKQDLATDKRVELHAHTKMSAMDSVMELSDYIDTAARWGHPALAITDHGVVHSFPEAYSIMQDRKKKKKAVLKLIYGMEGYVIDRVESRRNDDDEKGEERQKPYHIILLAKNKTGLKNLYKLVSYSHIEQYYKKPRIPKEILEKYKEGLLVGSACYMGEIYQALLEKADDVTLEAIAQIYDYFEIQPVDNNRFLVRKGILKNDEAIRDLNRRVIELGRRLGKMTVATTDAHFLKPEDKIYRMVLMSGMNYEDVGEGDMSDLSFKTTDDMLKEFEYLGGDVAQEIVVRNPAAISALVEDNLEPVPSKLFPPSLANSDEEISGVTLENAVKIYGNPLPELISARIKKELDAIIKHGFSVLYLIAKKMVEKSNSDGYVVGSRGSVGSSVVAYFSGISEVNPLPPHYLCPACKKTEFVDSDLAGVDLDDKKCSCGTQYRKEGFNIPFETFVGFEGDKTPDIDLNFSGEYQEKIHDFVINLFGEKQVFRAGTIVGVNEKAVKKDFIEKFKEKTRRAFNNAEADRLALGCSGVKRTTGQHPGGLMLVPDNYDVEEFTPVQWSPQKDSKTTHFEFKWIHDTLVKIDALGHDLPTSLNRLSRQLKIKPEDIPIDDRETMRIFSDIKPLGVDPKNYDHPVGTLGVPEYGTAFTRRMLMATKPKTFSELVYIAGLSHGTNVWNGNAEELIKSKTATLKEVISVRDDIMNYLIHKGLPNKKAFAITEMVRKGKGLKEEDEALMRKHKVPEWYISSCKKISYMFPKAHAVAYAIMSFRLAYIKVHHPIYFYADYLNRRKGGYEYEYAEMDMRGISEKIKQFRFVKSMDAKDKEQLEVAEVMFEMKDRGIQFSPIDIYASDPVIFTVKDNRIVPPLTVVPDLGEKVATGIGVERQRAEFSSVEDMTKRTKINKNVLKFLQDHRMLGEMPASDQIVLF